MPLTAPHTSLNRPMPPPNGALIDAAKDGLISNNYILPEKNVEPSPLFVPHLLFPYRYHWIGSTPWASKYWLVWLKWWFPKNPRCADKGEGCGDCKTRCRLRSIKSPFRWAYDPHRINTKCSRSSANLWITASVNVSQPLPWWDAALWASTVRVAFKSKTPCCAHRVKFPLRGTGIPKSLSISLKIFWSEGGKGIWSLTEKQSPCAWRGSW